ncbi:MAG: hypothetical protein JG760_1265 [Desulfomicrobiaceae bacterium]|nr:hypothetical protein [Desulfomicrobiaceae bacterium]
MPADEGKQQGILDDRVGEPHEGDGGHGVFGAHAAAAGLREDEAAAIGEPEHRAGYGDEGRFRADAHGP